MSIIKHTIKLNSVNVSGTTVINDANIKISLGNNDNFIGLQQEIDNLTSFTAIDLINSSNDEEKRKYKVVTTPTTPTLTFYFYSGATYGNNFIKAGFTIAELLQNNFFYSFFIIDLYDTYDINTQQKIFTTYLTKKGNTIPKYNISATTNQLYYWYIPESYINGNTGTTTAYAKLMFYNAKTGKVVTFYNKANESSIGADKIHFEVELNHIYKTWKFTSPNVNAYELVNEKYADKVNNTTDNVDNLKQVFPTGTTITYGGGSISYLTI